MEATTISSKISVIEQVKKFQEFIESTYYNVLLDNARKGNHSLLIDFADLSKYDLDLASELLDAPEETIKAIEKSIEQFDIESLKNFRIRFQSPKKPVCNGKKYSKPAYKQISFCEWNNKAEV